MKFPIRIISFLYLSFFIVNIANAQIQRVMTGEILSVNLSTKLTPQDQVKLGQTQAVILDKADGHRILAGIDLNTIPGQYLFTVQSKKQQLKSINYIVVATRQQFLNNPPHFNSLTNSNAIKKKLIWSNREPKLPLIYPAEGNWNQFFGRYYENSHKSSVQNNIFKKSFIQDSKNKNTLKKLHRIDHTSLSFNKPLAILSPSDAVCFMVSFDEKYGYTVLLDHGMGLFSEISGLVNLTISEQDKISKGSVIANFTQEHFVNKKQPKSTKNNTIQWRVFLTKSVINPVSLTKPL